MNEDPPRPFELLVTLLGSTPEPEAVARVERRAPLALLTALSLAGLALYGAGAGLFQGGAQVGVAALKVPFVVLFALLLTLPSLAVMTALTGATWTARRLVVAALVFTAALTLILAALLPVAWLFSVSSRFLLSPVIVHFLAWAIAVLLARRALRVVLLGRGVAAFRWWTALFLLVSLQAATFLQPILYRPPGRSLFPRPRQLFLLHLSDAARIELPEATASKSEPFDRP